MRFGERDFVRLWVGDVAGSHPLMPGRTAQTCPCRCAWTSRVTISWRSRCVLTSSRSAASRAVIVLRDIDTLHLRSRNNTVIHLEEGSDRRVGSAPTVSRTPTLNSVACAVGSPAPLAQCTPVVLHRHFCPINRWIRE